MTPRRILPPLTIVLLAVLLSACDLRPHAGVTLVAPPISNDELLSQITDTMGGLGYQAEEFASVNGKPIGREEASPSARSIPAPTPALMARRCVRAPARRCWSGPARAACISLPA